MCIRDRETIFPKLRVHIKDNNNSPHDKFHRFLFLFSSKFPNRNFAPYVLYIYSCYETIRDTNSEPVLPVIRYCISWKYAWKDIKRLLAPVRLFLQISLSICYALLLVLSVFCFPQTDSNIQRFRTLLSFSLGINYNEFIMNAFGSRSTSVGQL